MQSKVNRWQHRFDSQRMAAWTGSTENDRRQCENDACCASHNFPFKSDGLSAFLLWSNYLTDKSRRRISQSSSLSGTSPWRHPTNTFVVFTHDSFRNLRREIATALVVGAFSKKRLRWMPRYTELVADVEVALPPLYSRDPILTSQAIQWRR